MSKTRNKHGISVTGPWLPLSLDFLKSRACAELSPHGVKLLFDLFSMLGPNATRNGDLCITPKVMSVRGWSGRSSLTAAVRELLDHGLLVKTKQGNRLDCSLFAITLYHLSCDLSKLDVKPGSYRTTDYMGDGATLAKPPTEEKLARWRRARKTKTVAPPRNVTTSKRTATVQTIVAESLK